jgi:hypothetical protein
VKKQGLRKYAQINSQHCTVVHPIRGACAGTWCAFGALFVMYHAHTLVPNNTRHGRQLLHRCAKLAGSAHKVVPCGKTLPLFLGADRIGSLRGAPFYSIETNSLGFFPQLSAPRRQCRALMFVSAGMNALTGTN